MPLNVNEKPSGTVRTPSSESPRLVPGGDSESREHWASALPAKTAVRAEMARILSMFSPWGSRVRPTHRNEVVCGTGGASGRGDSSERNPSGKGGGFGAREVPASGGTHAACRVHCG